MSQWFESLSIRRKLIVLLVLASTLSLAIGSVATLVHDIQTSRVASENRLWTVAKVVGDNSRAAIEFSDVEGAERTLASLRNEASVEAACLFDSTRSPFAAYLADEAYRDQLPDSPPRFGKSSSWRATEVTTEIRDEDGTIGCLYLCANTDRLRETAVSKLKIHMLILAAVIGLSFAVASRIERAVSERIIRLCELTRDVQLRQDFSLRAECGAADEVGTLCDAFNDMLLQIELHQSRLKESNDELEQRVVQRTTDLQNINKKLQEEIEGHQRARDELQHVQAELVSTARAAGMAELATGVLHNVGNVLNSVNVTTGLIKENVGQWGSYGQGIDGVRKLMNENRETLGPFFSTHPKGMRVIDYLTKLAGTMCTKSDKVAKEVANLASLVDHIKEIVAAQQSMARVRGVLMPVKLSQLLDEALKLNNVSLIRQDIKIEMDVEDDPTFQSDKHRILQILVNLISNAKHAMDLIPADQRRMALRVKQVSESKIAVMVEDTGAGISAAHLKRIFQHGFTTKKNGHGFGLHASAIAAVELGGTLSVHSDGPGTGASFVLELPLVRP